MLDPRGRGVRESRDVDVTLGVHVDARWGRGGRAGRPRWLDPNLPTKTPSVVELLDAPVELLGDEDVAVGAARASMARGLLNSPSPLPLVPSPPFLPHFAAQVSVLSPVVDLELLDAVVQHVGDVEVVAVDGDVAGEVELAVAGADVEVAAVAVNERRSAPSSRQTPICRRCRSRRCVGVELDDAVVRPSRRSKTLPLESDVKAVAVARACSRCRPCRRTPRRRQPLNLAKPAGMVTYTLPFESVAMPLG